MYNLVIDFGNTNSKLAVFKSRELVHFEKSQLLDHRRIAELLDTYEVRSSTVSSVNKEHADITALLQERTRYTAFSTRLNPGIKSTYSTPDTLGLDRWAKVIAAYQLYPESDCFLIDAGTCITYDFLSSQADYAGGSISMGLQMRFEALHHFTGRLPRVAWTKQQVLIPEGNSTSNAILSGVLQGAFNEVKGFINSQLLHHHKLKVVFTGGDASFFTEQLKADRSVSVEIIHRPNLVLEGLNEVIAFEYVQKS